MPNRINVFIPDALMERVRHTEVQNVSRLCQAILMAACVAIETGTPQTVTVAIEEVVTRKLVVRA